MTENTMMNETTETTTVPTENTFGKAFKNVALFPFRAALVFFVLLNVFFAVRAAFPMDLPEAQGMTYYQFLSERFNAYNNYSKTDSNIMTYVSFAMYPGSYYFGDAPYTLLAAFNPEGKAAEYLTTHKTGYPRAFTKPRGEVKLTNLPNLLWELNERFSWVWFVTYKPQYGYPQPPSNK